jgi:hypothetical protein
LEDRESTKLLQLTSKRDGIVQIVTQVILPEREMM